VCLVFKKLGVRVGVRSEIRVNTVVRLELGLGLSVTVYSVYLFFYQLSSVMQF